MSNQKLGKHIYIIRIWPGVSHAFCNQDSKYFKPKTRDDAFKVTRRLFES